MSNIRKQTLIIAVLIVLIGCAGWFAKRFNNMVQDTNALSTKITEQNNKNTNFFAESRLSREEQVSSMKQELQNIINDKQTPKKSKEKATAQLMQLIDRGGKQNKIETMIKERGYEDALCVINDHSIEICVKSNANLDSKKVNELKDLTVKATGMSPSNIVIRQKQ